MSRTDAPGLMPIGHLVNARRAVERYTETGSQLDAGRVADELDELRRLLDAVAAAFDSLATDARVTPGLAQRRHSRVPSAADEVAAIAERVRQLVAENVRPAALRLLGEAATTRRAVA